MGRIGFPAKARRIDVGKQVVEQSPVGPPPTPPVNPVGENSPAAGVEELDAPGHAVSALGNDSTTIVPVMLPKSPPRIA